MSLLVIDRKYNIKNICISLGVFFQFIGYNTVFGNSGIILNYLGLVIFIMYIIGDVYRHITFNINKEKSEFIGLIVLLSLGLVMQKDLTVWQKTSPIISFAIMAVLYIYGYRIIDNLDRVRLFGYALLITFILSMMVTPLLGGEIIMRPTEGMSYALTAGLGHKNLSSVCLLAAFMALAAYYKFVKKNKFDFVAIVMLILFIIAGASRAAWLLMLIYIGLLNLDVMNKLKKSSRYIFYILLTAFILLLGYVFVSMIMSESQSYGVRIIGLYSYLYQYGNDYAVMAFGHGDILYNELYGDYDHRIWILLGGVGTFEIAYVNILAKNGLIGFLAYLYIYFWPIMVGIRTKYSLYKIMLLALSITSLVSGCVDIFISLVTAPFTVFILCVLSYIKHECDICADMEI